MKLEQRVNFSLIPILSIVVILLSFVTWKLTFDESRAIEVERSKLSLEIALVRTEQLVSELDSALSKAGEYSTQFNIVLESISPARRNLLGANFIDFAYQLSSQIDDFDQVTILDQQLSPITNIRLDDLVNFTPTNNLLNSTDQQVIAELHGYLKSKLMTEGAIAYKTPTGYRLLGIRMMSPYANEGTSLIWGNDHYLVAVFLEPKYITQTEQFNIDVLGPTNLNVINSQNIPMMHSFTTSDDILTTSTPLFTFSKKVTRAQISEKMRSYTALVVVTAIALIISLIIIVLYVLRRNVLSPIKELELKVTQSVDTGVLDIEPSTNDNEINRLGNRYIDLMDQIFSLAYIDPLTKLPNRQQFINKTNKLLRKHRRQTFAMLYLDLDRFKQVNDFYGHGAGDQLLIDFSRDLKNAVAANLTDDNDINTIISRLAGDEFAVFVAKDSLQTDFATLAESLITAMEKGFQSDQGMLHLEVSVGVALYPLHGHKAEALIAAADEAMFEAKSQGRNRWTLLDDQIIAKNNDKKIIQEAIEDSLQNNLFYLVFQPVFETQTDQLIGAETLLRSNHPVLSKVGTERFIQIAEKNGAIRRIDTFVANNAMKALQHIQRRAPKFRLAINISPTELTSTIFPDTLSNLLDVYQHQAKDIVLEVTETELTEFDEQALMNLTKLREMGFSIALDDFGTGYNSFAQLNSRTVTSLKIDRRFIDAINTDTSDGKMVDVILGLADLYQLRVVAEGVETKEQLAQLKQTRCDLVQGYYMSKPLEFDDLQRFITEYSAS